MDSSLNDISQLIRMKEKELHEIHDQRCTQLEQLVAERDSLLIESSKRFEQLRDDFQYNLALLEARDEEIERLEGHIQRTNTELGVTDSERRTYKSRIDILEIRETERSEKHEENKAANKRILQELKDVIESMRWASAEEARLKLKEIGNLKEDLQRVNFSREESLEAQRRDLTQTFENLIHQREESFAKKEKEISNQILLLDQKFEELRTDNTRLKSDNNDYQRKLEASSNDLLNKEEQCRQFQWQLDDERNNQLKGDDQMQRRLLQLNLDLVNAKEKNVQDLLDHQRVLDKTANEYEREKEFRIIIEKRFHELQSTNREELKTLVEEIAKTRKSESESRKENITIKEEKEKINEKNKFYQKDLEALNLKNNLMINENDFLKTEINNYRIKLDENEIKMISIENDFNESKKEATELSLDLERQATDRLITAESAWNAEIDKMRESAKAENSIREREASTQHAAHILDLERNLSEAGRDREEARVALREISIALEEEQMEGKALRLRLSIQEAQVLEYQKHIQSMQNEAQRQEAFSLGLVVGASVDSTAPGSAIPVFLSDSMLPSEFTRSYPHQQHYPTQAINYDPDYNRSVPLRGHTPYDNDNGMGVSSPIFSEDYGPVSFADSPLLDTFQEGNRVIEREREREREREGSRGLDSIRKGNDFNNINYPNDFSPNNKVRQNQVKDSFQNNNNTQYEQRQPVHQNKRQMSRDDCDNEVYGQQHVLGRPYSLSGDAADAAAAAAVVAENERLKAVIKEMRADVETLQAQVVHQIPPRIQGLESRGLGLELRVQSPEYDGKGNSFGLLERRLEQTVSEVSRLRDERTRLMDVGNELRAALNRQNHQGDGMSLKSDQNDNNNNKNDRIDKLYSSTNGRRSNNSNDNSNNNDNSYNNIQRSPFGMGSTSGPGSGMRTGSSPQRAGGGGGGRVPASAWTDRSFRGQGTRQDSQDLHSDENLVMNLKLRSSEISQVEVRGSSLSSTRKNNGSGNHNGNGNSNIERGNDDDNDYINDNDDDNTHQFYRNRNYQNLSLHTSLYEGTDRDGQKDRSRVGLKENEIGKSSRIPLPSNSYKNYPSTPRTIPGTNPTQSSLTSTPKGNIGTNYGNSTNSVSIGLTNSERTTQSQMKALKRIEEQNTHRYQRDDQPRKVLNYAIKGNNEEEVNEDINN